MHALHDSLEELVEGDAGADGGWEVEYSVSRLCCFGSLLKRAGGRPHEAVRQHSRVLNLLRALRWPRVLAGVDVQESASLGLQGVRSHMSLSPKADWLLLTLD